MGFIPWDNPDNIVSQETEKAVETAVGAVCLPVLFLLSVPCNVLNMAVFWKQGLSERINLCLFCLSLVDFLHVLNRFVVNVDRLRPPFTEDTGPVFEFIIQHKLIGLRSFTWLSGFISMLIACERCLCVVSPLRSQTILKTRTTAVLLAMGTVLIMPGSFLIGLRWGLACVFDPDTNTTSKNIYTGKFYAQNKEHLDVLTFFVATLQPFTYVTVVLATTIVTSVKLKKMASWREKTSSGVLSSREVALTRTLIAVSVLYLVCSVPMIASGVGAMFVPGYSFNGKYYNIAHLLISLLELGSFVNATFNFFVYWSMGSRFRDTLSELTRCVFWYGGGSHCFAVDDRAGHTALLLMTGRVTLLCCRRGGSHCFAVVGSHCFAVDDRAGHTALLSSGHTALLLTTGRRSVQTSTVRIRNSAVRNAGWVTQRHEGIHKDLLDGDRDDIPQADPNSL
ncbi:uncharacterized protein LOC143293111 [Babylonia areolata]|uniref:uncharacterized protein LOC143293111 n=1 Tax=Babylonia areolata TaxID=304850 RepID=UPI003FD4DDAD